MHPFVFRLLASGLVSIAIAVLVFSLYSLWEHVLPIYGRIQRNAPVVETPYLAFTMLMAPPALLLAIVGASIAAWTGKKFDPPNNSFLDNFSVLMMYLSVKTLTYVIPTVMILTTAILLYRDYSPCPKLLISGSAWQLFWVNQKNACFKPTRYINDHWPCKMIGRQEVCIRVDGR